MGANTQRSPIQSLLPLEKAVQDWLDQPIGELDRTIPPEGNWKPLYGSQVAALFNQVQLAETGADFSCTSLGNDPVGLASPVTMGGDSGLPFCKHPGGAGGNGGGAETDSGAVRRLLHPWLMASPRFRRSSCSPRWSTTTTTSMPGSPTPSICAGPVGSRVIRLAKLDGSPLGSGKFRLCTSNYRATGTGGYEILRKCPVLWRAAQKCRISPPAIQTHSPMPQLHNVEMRVIW